MASTGKCIQRYDMNGTAMLVSMIAGFKGKFPACVVTIAQVEKILQFPINRYPKSDTI